MTMWYDDRTKRYKTSLPYKVFYIWGWPLERWVMFNCMTSEFAHWFTIHVAIPFVGKVDRIWERVVTIMAVIALIFIVLLSLLPGFSLEGPKEPMP